MFFLLILSAVLQTAGAVMSYKNSKAQAKATAEEGALKAAQRDRQTRQLAARQKTSFLNSGISLTGDGDVADVVMQDTYDTGIADINLIKSNYNTQSKNIMSAARSQFFSSMGSMVLGTVAGAGGLGGGTASATNAGAMNTSQIGAMQGTSQYSGAGFGVLK